MIDEELEKMMEDIDIQSKKENEKAKPEKEKPEKQWQEEEAESNITEEEYKKLDNKGREKYGI